MSKNINDEKLLFEVKVDDPVIEMPNKKEEVVYNTENMTPEEAFLINDGNNNIDLNKEEIDSIVTNNQLAEQNKQEMDPEINRIVDYHKKLISQRYGPEAVEDFIHNNIYNSK